MLWSIILAIAAFFLFFQAVRVHILLGVAVIIAFLAIIVYMRYTSICILIAQRCYTKGNIDQAFVWFERAYKHGMTNHQKTDYAYYLMRNGKLEESEAIYNRMLGFKLPAQDRYHAKSCYAILLWKQGHIDRAIEELEEIFPYYRTSNVYGTLGYMYILKEDWARAEEFNREAYDYNNENTVILDNMVILCYRLNRPEEAEKYADELLAQNPTFAEGLYDIALVKHALKKDGEALSALKTALDITPTFMTTVKPDKLQALIDEIKAGYTPAELAALENQDTDAVEEE